jgi:hypothetical protein
MSSLLNRINEALDETGLSARAASLQAGLSPRFLSDLVAGAKRSMSIENAEKLAPVLHRTPEYLAFGRGPKSPGGASIVDIWDRIPLRSRDEARRMLSSLAANKDKESG